jgi:hypothetical protein
MIFIDKDSKGNNRIIKCETFQLTLSSSSTIYSENLINIWLYLDANYKQMGYKYMYGVPEVYLKHLNSIYNNVIRYIFINIKNKFKFDIDDIFNCITEKYLNNLCSIDTEEHINKYNMFKEYLLKNSLLKNGKKL